MSIKIIGPELRTMPWQDKPQGLRNSTIWRHSANPLIDRNPMENVSRIYNSAVVPYNGEFIGIFRCDHLDFMPYLHIGRSKDGLKWTFNPEPIELNGSLEMKGGSFFYDPRCIKIEDSYYIVWCNGYHGMPTIGIAVTKDFVHFEQKENAFLPANRNGVMFPRKINGNFAMLSRPSDLGHTPFGDIFYSESPDCTFWGKHRYVMGRKPSVWWESLKIGPGPAPIETSEGWLMFYHAVTQNCNCYVYSFSAAMLDLEQPWKVIYRSSKYMFTPEAIYETVGVVPNVTFPCATLQDAATGRITLYYGAADTVTGLAYTTIDEVFSFMKKHSVV